MKLVTEKPFWDVFPEAEIAVIKAFGLKRDSDDDETAYQDLDDLLSDSIERSRYYLNEENFEDNDVISSWRSAFKKCTVPADSCSFFETLLKKVSLDKDITAADPLDSVILSTALTGGLPCCGKDIDGLEGTLRLTAAAGGEEFTCAPAFMDTDDPHGTALPGEIVYMDDIGIVSRCWNWKESIRTVPSGTSTDILFTIDSADHSHRSELEDSAWTLANLIQKYFDGSVDIDYIYSGNRELELVR